MEKANFSKEEIERYSRHLILPEFTIEGQQKLKAAKVLVVGCGGLGSPLLLYLAAAGVGTIGIVDFDVVEKSNLQRQIIFTQEDVGKSKVIAAQQRLKSMNPFVKVITHSTRLTKENAVEVIKNYDLVADGTDNFPTRYLVNDTCVFLNKVNVYASIYRFEGQVSVFNCSRDDGSRGPNYRDLFPKPPPAGMVPSCAEGGILGVLPGILGSMQASEVIKIISGIGNPLDGRLFVIDALTFETHTLKVQKNPKNPLNNILESPLSQVDYEQLCTIGNVSIGTYTSVKEISVLELKKMMDNQDDFQLIDVREPYEYKISNLQGELIPQRMVNKLINKISQDRKVIIHCRSGKRSADIVLALQEKHGFSNLYSLAGGINAWAKEVDNTMAVY